MKRIKILPAVLIVIVILSMLSPFAVHKFQNLFLKTPVYNADVYKSTEVTLKTDDYIYFGKYLDEDILWKVLDVNENNILLMSEYVICFKAFDASGISEKFHNSDSEKYGSSDWENSTLKQWLNSEEFHVTYSHCPPVKDNTFTSYNYYNDECGFLNEKNFCDEEKKLITDDGVFLLSKSQLKKFFDNTSRKKICTNSCIKQNNAPYIILPDRPVWYWSSSPATSNNVSVTAVTSSGNFYKSLAYDGTMGVCPALYINNRSFKTGGGDGSKKAPYVLEVK